MSHTTPRLVVDIFDGEFYSGDPHAAWTWMRENEPVYYDEISTLWGITKYEDIKVCSTDPGLFSSASGNRPKSWAMPMMIMMDPPQQTMRRKLVSSGFTPRAIAALREHVARICDEVLDRVTELGTCEFVHDVAAPLPLIVIGDLLGVAPEDRDDLLRWSDTMLKSEGASDPAVLEAAAGAFGEFSSYILRVVDERRRGEGHADDIIGILVNAEVDGERLSDDDLIYETMLILIGGDETSRHVLSGGVLALLEHPQQLSVLKSDPSKVTGAVEEMLRWVSPVKNMARTLTRDTFLRGRELKEGDQILLFYPSANRDEDVFDNPFSFDIARPENPHIAFGIGQHFCLGNQLARLELTIMINKVLERMPDLRLAPDASLPLRPSNFVSGLEAMKVEFTPTPSRGSD